MAKGTNKQLIENAIKAIEAATGKKVKLVEAEELNELTKGLVQRAHSVADNRDRETTDPLMNRKREDQMIKFANYINPKISELAYRLGFRAVPGDGCVHVFVDGPKSVRALLHVKVQANGYEILGGDTHSVDPDTIKKLLNFIKKIQADLNSGEQQNKMAA